MDQIVSPEKLSLTVMNYRIQHPKNIQKIEGDLRMEGYRARSKKKKDTIISLYSIGRIQGL